MGEVIRVAVVDDDPLVRTGLGLILGGSPRIELVGEAGDGTEVADLVRRTSPDVVLMDIRMPRKDGLAATRELLAQADAPRVLVLTTFDSDDSVLQALQAGAAGFLLKDTPPERLVSAVLAVAAGEPILSPSVANQVIAAATRPAAGRRRDAARDHLAGLSERELEIAVEIGRGLSNAEIAATVHVSVATVKAYVTRIFAKVNAENRVQVAMLVHDAELL
ncbi:response regulator transcription factor [Propionicicella superfundia]|uniref:response regulator transcription factor n=1 Tax=Propionicicella superfundia TaxID=348582 RepID=UPI00041CED16|nr:response regulator transcription factor [Propionicicella superfundia]